jgi:hypothetical protein
VTPERLAEISATHQRATHPTTAMDLRTPSYVRDVGDLLTALAEAQTHTVEARQAAEEWRSLAFRLHDEIHGARRSPMRE